MGSNWLVDFARKDLETHLRLKDMKEYIQETSHTGVKYVEELLTRKKAYSAIS